MNKKTCRLTLDVDYDPEQTTPAAIRDELEKTLTDRDLFRVLHENANVTGIDNVAVQLAQVPADVWGADSQYPRHEWNREAGDNDTTLGYWEWVEHQRQFVTCSLCGRRCDAGKAHRHQDEWIGDECCWDEHQREAAESDKENQ